MDQHPELAHVFNNPEMLRESMQMANNPVCFCPLPLAVQDQPHLGNAHRARALFAHCRCMADASNPHLVSSTIGSGYQT